MTTKANLVTRLSSATGLTKKQAFDAINTLAGFVYQDLNFDGEALIPGIGKLKIRTRGERIGRNPRTGDSLTIASRGVVKFSATRHLKLFVAAISDKSADSQAS